jgi:tetratricopeptide (TPR) repeat protein
MAQSKSRYTPPAVSTPAGPPWLTFILIALGSAATGVIGTYLVLQSRLPRPAELTAQPLASSSVANVPPAQLTAGVPPAQADRNLGNFFYDQNDWTQAIRHYESAIRLGADDADIRTDLGNAFQFSGQTDAALEQYRTAQRMNPGHEFSLFNQGGLYLERLNQPQKAVEIWNEYLRRFPQGQNAAAARQLIAQASGHLSGTAPLFPAAAATVPAGAAPAPASPTDPDVEKLLRLVPPAPASHKP